jgi:molybdopterin-guanine dinucleotide biosynthesis protein A
VKKPSSPASAPLRRGRQSSRLYKGQQRIQRLAKTSLSAVLLAGGESRRMGTDKARLLFRGQPLWQVQLETLRRLQLEEIFVSARNDPSWRPDDVHFIADVPPARGPLSGLAASLDRISTHHLLALAIDMPWMSNEYLKSLCAQIEPGRGVVPRVGDRAEPLAAIYPREAMDEIRDALAGTDFSLQSLIGDLITAGKMREITVTEQQRNLFRNVNERADLQIT